MTKDKTHFASHLPLIIIMGPTGSGKSNIAMQLASNIPSEIISADSMQVYKGMDIGTAKPNAKERAKFPHYMVDILEVNQRLDVFFYVEKAQAAINKILSKNKYPIIAGGTGMYIRALLYGLDPLPSDRILREKILDIFSSENGTEQLVRLLSKKDPNALKIFGQNPRKLMRALEVLELTGKSITEQQKEWNQNQLQYSNIRAFKIFWDNQTLFDRITARVETMLNNGWIEEAEFLIKQGLLSFPTARQAIGYTIIVEYLDGKINYQTMKEKIISATKKYARRQKTWFKHQHPEAQTIVPELNDKSFVETVVTLIKHTI